MKSLNYQGWGEEEKKTQILLFLYNMFLPRWIYGYGTHVLWRWQMARFMSSASFCVLSVPDKQLLKSSATIVNIFLILHFFFGFVYFLILFSDPTQTQCFVHARLCNWSAFQPPVCILNCWLYVYLNLRLFYLGEFAP